MLPNDNTGSNLHNEVTYLLYILINLSATDVNHVKAIISHKALPKIVMISNADKRLVSAHLNAPHARLCDFTVFLLILVIFSLYLY